MEFLQLNKKQKTENKEDVELKKAIKLSILENNNDNNNTEFLYYFNDISSLIKEKNNITISISDIIQVFYFFF